MGLKSKVSSMVSRGVLEVERAQPNTARTYNLARTSKYSSATAGRDSPKFDTCRVCRTLLVSSTLPVIQRRQACWQGHQRTQVRAVVRYRVPAPWCVALPGRRGAAAPWLRHRSSCLAPQWQERRRTCAYRELRGPPPSARLARRHARRHAYQALAAVGATSAGCAARRARQRRRDATAQGAADGRAMPRAMRRRLRAA